MKKAIHIFFVCLVFAILLAGLAQTLFFPKEVNNYENRYAQKFPAFTPESYEAGSFQDGADAALMDQITGAEQMKSLYNRCTTRYLKDSLAVVSQKADLDQNRYVAFQGLCLFGGKNLVYYPRTLSSVQQALDQNIASLNQTFARHPELTFYVYYIEKDTDFDFETGEKCGLSAYLLDHLTLPAKQKDVDPMDSFSQFSKTFYQTDAHWNYLGSYDGYLRVTKLLGSQGAPLKPVGDPVKISDRFSGKKAALVGGDGVFTEDFWAYPFAFPAMSITINGQSAADYGNQDAYLRGQDPGLVTYGGFYGGDNGETTFSTQTKGRGNLLVLGESFDNALLKLLASHYDNTYSVDLRYYKTYMGQPFDFSSYVKEHKISKILLIGNIDFFIQNTFLPEG